MVKDIMSSSASLISANNQLTASAENLSQGASEQVNRAIQVAEASTQMNQASEEISKAAYPSIRTGIQPRKRCPQFQDLTGRAYTTILLSRALYWIASAI